jgi:hypothetical protein
MDRVEVCSGQKEAFQKKKRSNGGKTVNNNLTGTQCKSTHLLLEVKLSRLKSSQLLIIAQTKIYKKASKKNNYL